MQAFRPHLAWRSRWNYRSDQDRNIVNLVRPVKPVRMAVYLRPNPPYAQLDHAGPETLHSMPAATEMD
jgi:hypothetical protein